MLDIAVCTDILYSVRSTVHKIMLEEYWKECWGRPHQQNCSLFMLGDNNVLNSRALQFQHLKHAVLASSTSEMFDKSHFLTSYIPSWFTDFNLTHFVLSCPNHTNQFLLFQVYSWPLLQVFNHFYIEELVVWMFSFEHLNLLWPASYKIPSTFSILFTHRKSSGTFSRERNSNFTILKSYFSEITT